MEVELAEKIVECLRGLEIGESIPADGIADEIGTRLGNVYDALEEMEREKLIVMHPAVMKHHDPTYTLTPTGRRYGTAVTVHAGKVSECDEEPEHETVQTAPMPSAERVCRFCKKEMEPNKVRRHERFCKANPDRDMPGKVPTHTEQAAPASIEITQESLPPKVVSDPVPPPSDYVEGFEMDGGTITPSGPVKAENEVTFTIIGQQQAAEDPTAPDEVPELDERTDRVINRVEDGFDRFLARIRDKDVLSLKESPNMSAVLRLLSCCQRAADEGADLTLDAHVKVAAGFYVNIAMDIPVKEDP